MMKMLRLNSKKSLSHGLNELNKQADSKIKSSGEKNRQTFEQFGWPIDKSNRVSDSNLGNIKNKIFTSQRGSQLDLTNSHKQNKMGTYEYSYDKNNWIIAKVQVKQLDAVLQAQGQFIATILLKNIEYPIKGTIDRHLITSVSCSKDLVFHNKLQTVINWPASQAIHEFLYQEFKQNSSSSMLNWLVSSIKTMGISAGQWLTTMAEDFSLVDPTESDEELKLHHKMTHIPAVKTSTEKESEQESKLRDLSFMSNPNYYIEGSEWV